MNFKILKDNCEGYQFKKGTKAETAIELNNCGIDEQNYFAERFDGFCEIYWNKLCELDGKLYAVDFGFKRENGEYDFDAPYIWQEVETI